MTSIPRSYSWHTTFDESHINVNGVLTQKFDESHIAMKEEVILDVFSKSVSSVSSHVYGAKHFGMKYGQKPIDVSFDDHSKVYHHLLLDTFPQRTSRNNQQKRSEAMPILWIQLRLVIDTDLLSLLRL